MVLPVAAGPLQQEQERRDVQNGNQRCPGLVFQPIKQKTGTKNKRNVGIEKGVGIDTRAA